MKKGTKTILHLILTGIISAISYLGFKKGVEIVEKYMKKKTNQPPES